MNTKSLSALSLMAASALTLGTLIAPQVNAFNGDQGDREAMQELHQQITHEITKLDNGIQMTITSENAEALEFIREHEEKHSQKQRDNVNVTTTDLDNGVQVTITSEDSEVIEKLHERADRDLERESISRTVEKLDNGVKITMTSTLPQVVEKLQSKEMKEPKNDAISIIRENISNGVQTIITSEDPDLVERIQERSEKGPRMGRRQGKGNHGMRGHKKGPHRDGEGPDRERGPFGPEGAEE